MSLVSTNHPQELGVVGVQRRVVRRVVLDAYGDLAVLYDQAAVRNFRIVGEGATRGRSNHSDGTVTSIQSLD